MKKINSILQFIAQKLEEIQNKFKEYATKTDLNAYAKPADVDAKIKQVVGAAPEALDTLEEIAKELQKNSSAAASITNQLTQKADKSELDSYAKLDSPILTGNPQSTGTIRSDSNSNTLATTKWVKERITEAAIAGTDAISVSAEVEEAYKKLGWVAPAN